jgi:hypothetical protein
MSQTSGCRENLAVKCRPIADDHGEPLVELRRLLGVWRRERAPGLQHAPRKAAPAGLIDLDAIEAPWIAAGLDLRLRR